MGGRRPVPREGEERSLRFSPKVKEDALRFLAGIGSPASDEMEINQDWTCGASGGDPRSEARRFRPPAPPLRPPFPARLLGAPAPQEGSTAACFVGAGLRAPPSPPPYTQTRGRGDVSILGCAARNVSTEGPGETGLGQRSWAPTPQHP